VRRKFAPIVTLTYTAKSFKINHLRWALGRADALDYAQVNDARRARARGANLSPQGRPIGTTKARRAAQCSAGLIVPGIDQKGLSEVDTSKNPTGGQAYSRFVFRVGENPHVVRADDSLAVIESILDLGAEHITEAHLDLIRTEAIWARQCLEPVKGITLCLN
jgi:hypothetical protein